MRILAQLEERILALDRVKGAERIIGASYHGWRLAPPWTEPQLDRFEKQRRVELPAGYRSWLLLVSASGAGPGNGLFEPGTWDTGGGLKRWTGRQIGPLGEPFPHEQEVDFPCAISAAASSQSSSRLLHAARPKTDIHSGLDARDRAGGPPHRRR